jgi:RimJ/RimL family protein N-acetyltransferase
MILRKVDEKDLELLKILKDDSWYGTHRIAIVNISDQKRWFEQISKDLSSLYMIVSDGRSSIGLYKITNIDWISRCYDSAHDIFSDFRGKGYSKLVLEAGVDFGFEVLNMHRLNTEILKGNWSDKAALYAGFVYEGTKRKAIYKNGFWLDSDVYGILRDDWSSLERVKNYGSVCNESPFLKGEDKT